MKKTCLKTTLTKFPTVRILYGGAYVAKNRGRGRLNSHEIQ